MESDLTLVCLLNAIINVFIMFLKIEKAMHLVSSCKYLCIKKLLEVGDYDQLDQHSLLFVDHFPVLYNI